MSGEVQSVPAEIVAGADAMSAAATAVARHVPRELADVSGMLPGSVSGPAAHALEAQWRRSIAAWVGDAEQHTGHMRAAARDWADIDEERRQQLGSLGRGTGIA